jgi:protein MAK11|eukprot:jgi/Chrpa1/15726/Chrysochromulina_OHIO_Genome00006951-RA
MGPTYLTVGSYEGHLVGYRLDPPALALEGDAELRRAAVPTSFAIKAHDGCLRAIASGGSYMATCGTDHAISVYNLRKLREQGKLLQQAGGVTLHCLAFFGESHLVSGGGDGELCIWRASDWECLLRMKGHKGAVHAIAIHPSGRAALSVAADSKLMLWNLTTGKCNYTAALAEPARLLSWSPDGESYVHDTRRALLLHALRSGELLHSFPHDSSPPLALAFAPDGLLLSGDDAGTLRVWSVAEGHCVHTEKNAHARRIKGITQLPSEEVASTGKGGARHHAFATACSDGIVSVWRLSTSSGSALSSGKTSAGGQSGKTRAGAATLQRLFSIETRLRLTAISASTPARVVMPVGKSPREGAPPSTAPVAPANKRANAAQEAEGGDDEADDAAEEADAVVEAPIEKKRQRATVDSGVQMSRALSSSTSIEDSEPSLTKVLKKKKKRENRGVGATPE